MCGLWTSSVSITWRLEMQILESHPRPIESETWGVARPSVCLPGDANAGSTQKCLKSLFLQSHCCWRKQVLVVSQERNFRDTAYTNNTIDPHSLYRNQPRDKKLFNEQVQYSPSLSNNPYFLWEPLPPTLRACGLDIVAPDAGVGKRLRPN